MPRWDQSTAANRTLRLCPDRCREARRRLGCSREGLAERSNGPHPLSEATIKRAESGAALYLATARRLAEVLQVPLTELLTDPDAAPVATPSEAGPLASSALTALAAGQAPALAVVPFRSIDASEDRGYFAEGLTEDLLTRMGSWWFPVIARGSTFQLASQTDFDELRASCEAMGVKYLVEGSVRRTDSDLRVAARLVDVGTGHVVWANRFDRPFAGVFSLQDELAALIVGQLEDKLLDVEGRRAEGHDPQDLDAWELALHGGWHFYRRQRGSNLNARGLMLEAVRREQRLPLAWYLLSLTYQQEILQQWTREPSATLNQMRETVRHFEHLYPKSALSQVAAAYVDVYSGQRGAARARLEEAIGTDPNLSLAYALYGQVLAMGLEPDAAIEQLELAHRLSPRDSDRWIILLSVALSHFAAARYDQAVLWATRAVEDRPDVAFCHGALASAHALRGDLEHAAAAWRKMREVDSSAAPGGYGAIMASTEPEIAMRYLEGLKRAERAQ